MSAENYDKSIDRVIARAHVLAHLISMPVQLIHLRVAEFKWLLDVIQFVSIYYTHNLLVF
jgi:hypothetical protein